MARLEVGGTVANMEAGYRKVAEQQPTMSTQTCFLIREQTDSLGAKKNVNWSCSPAYNSGGLYAAAFQTVQSRWLLRQNVSSRPKTVDLTVTVEDAWSMSHIH